MRLHAAVFGFDSGTPTLILPYEEKCHEWARMTRQPAAAICDVADVTAARLESLPALPQPGLTVGEARQASLRNFRGLGL
jgi:polysaccharide pyruvyl transferase WcaK-like protein